MNYKGVKISTNGSEMEDPLWTRNSEVTRKTWQSAFLRLLTSVSKTPTKVPSSVYSLLSQ